MNKNRWLILIGLILVLTPLVNAERIELTQGWNYFSFVGNESNQVETDTNRYVSLSQGYNLIGYSSWNNITHTNVQINQSNGTSLTISQAVTQNLITEQFQILDREEDGTKGFQLVPLTDDSLRTDKAYWVYANASGLNLTFLGVGGANSSYSVPWGDLKFYRDGEVKSTSDALVAGWVGESGAAANTLIKYWDEGGASFSGVLASSSLSPWKGYVIWANNDNTSIIFNVNFLNPNVTSLTEKPTDPATYSPSGEYNFTANIVDDGTISNVLFEFGGVNYTVSNSGDIYNKTLVNLGVGTYNYRWYAIDNEGNVNNSEAGTYTINQATPELNLTLDTTEGNITVVIDSNVTITGATVTGDSSARLTLQNNGTLINNGTSPVQNITEMRFIYDTPITLTYEGSQNYSSRSLVYYINVIAQAVYSNYKGGLLYNNPNIYNSSRIPTLGFWWSLLR